MGANPRNMLDMDSLENHFEIEKCLDADCENFELAYTDNSWETRFKWEPVETEKSAGWSNQFKNSKTAEEFKDYGPMALARN